MAVIEPLHDRVLVERIPQKERLIVIPEAYAEGTRIAKVLAIGPGAWHGGYFYKTAVTPGHTVVLPGIAAKFPDWENSETILIQEADIGAILG